MHMLASIMLGMQVMCATCIGLMCEQHHTQTNIIMNACAAINGADEHNCSGCDITSPLMQYNHISKSLYRFDKQLFVGDSCCTVVLHVQIVH